MSTRIYNYGALEPTENLSVVDNNIFSYHRLKNQFAKIELWRRNLGNAAIETPADHPVRLAAEKLKATDDAMDALSEKTKKKRNHNLVSKSAQGEAYRGELAAFESVISGFEKEEHNYGTRLSEISREIDAIKSEMQAIKDEHSRRNQAARAKTKQPELAELKSAAKIRLKSLRATHKALKDAPGNKELWATLGCIAEEKRKAAYAGHFQGYYLPALEHTKRLGKGKPPRMKRYTGEGSTAAHIQGGMSCDELYACRNGQVRLEPVSTRYKKTKTVQFAILWLRVGSEGRAPVWTKVPVIMHRPLPPEARIKDVFLHRRKIGTKSKWSVQFVLNNVREKVAGGKGIVGLDVGWREVEGGLRVAYYTGNDGDASQFLLPDRVRPDLDKCSELQSLRDERFNAIVAEIKAVRDTLPEWLQEATQYIHSWKNPARLAKLAIRWRDSRYAGDEFLYARVEGWRAQDKHLLEWQSNQRLQAIDHRLDEYRKLAKRLSRKYKHIVIEDIDLKELATATPQDEYNVKKERLNRLRASVRSLHGALKDSGMEVIVVDREFPSSKRCHSCGQLNEIDSGPVHTCGGCGQTWDRDFNAAMNLMDFGIDKVRREGSGLANLPVTTRTVDTNGLTAKSGHLGVPFPTGVTLKCGADFVPIL